MFYIIIDLYCYLVICSLYVQYDIIYLFYLSVLFICFCASIIYLLVDPYITSCTVSGL